MMKVLVCVPELEKSGGIANYYRVLKQHFSMEVGYFTRGSRQGERGSLRDFRRLLADYGRFMWALSRDRNIRIVHFNTSFGARGIYRDSLFLLLAKLHRRKVLVFFRGWDERFERRVNRPSARLALQAFFLADRMLVLSTGFEDRLRRWGYTGRISMESTVVDQQLIDAAAEGSNGSAEQPAAGAFTLLFLARLERDKGVYTAVDTHAALLRHHPSIRLLIAGDGGERSNLARYVEERGIQNVEFLGYVRGEAKIEAFRSAHIYLFPTIHGEGMPNSVLEAMAFGLPVITRPVGGLRDFFLNGEMGFLTEAMDAEENAGLVRQLIETEELRTRMSQVNRRYAAEHFAAHKVVSRLEDVYLDLLAHESR